MEGRHRAHLTLNDGRIYGLCSDCGASGPVAQTEAEAQKWCDEHTDELTRLELEWHDFDLMEEELKPVQPEHFLTAEGYQQWYEEQQKRTRP